MNNNNALLAAVFTGAVVAWWWSKNKKIGRLPYPVLKTPELMKMWREGNNGTVNDEVAFFGNNAYISDSARDKAKEIDEVTLPRVTTDKAEIRKALKAVRRLDGATLWREFAEQPEILIPRGMKKLNPQWEQLLISNDDGMGLTGDDAYIRCLLH